MRPTWSKQPKLAGFKNFTVMLGRIRPRSLGVGRLFSKGLLGPKRNLKPGPSDSLNEKKKRCSQRESTEAKDKEPVTSDKDKDSSALRRSRFWKAKKGR